MFSLKVNPIVLFAMLTIILLMAIIAMVLIMVLAFLILNTPIYVPVSPNHHNVTTVLQFFRP